jgi:CheY-like chemotaxis protein
MLRRLIGANVRLTWDPGTDLWPVSLDPAQLDQVLTNLLVNAQQALAGQPGPRRVRIRTAYEAESKQLLLEISDNGPGMPPEVRSRIFEPFFTTKDKGSGTGIGLAVSHRILATHGGTISCDSTPGHGTTFSIRLPASPPERGTVEPGIVRSPGPDRLRIMVVDDEPDVADVVAAMLRADGHHVEVMFSGQAALERAMDMEPDLILSDIRMPGLDGPALYSKLVEFRPELAGRMAFITGDTLSPKARQFLEATDCPRLEKPVTPTELRELVVGFTSKHHG